VLSDKTRFGRPELTQPNFLAGTDYTRSDGLQRGCRKGGASGYTDDFMDQCGQGGELE
jgi:hypothetical protein